MTNILFPTDFSAGSLKLAEQAIQSLNIRSANIFLFHAFEQPSSEFDLLVPGRQKPYTDALTDSFRQACKQLKDQYPKAVSKICFKFLEGSTLRLFRNFIDANEIDLIICPDEYNHIAVNKLSVDPRPLFKKSGIKVIRALTENPVEKIYESVNVITQGSPVFAVN
jgi:hypothetical protein